MLEKNVRNGALSVRSLPSRFQEFLGLFEQTGISCLGKVLEKLSIHKSIDRSIEIARLGEPMMNALPEIDLRSALEARGISRRQFVEILQHHGCDPGVCPLDIYAL